MPPGMPCHVIVYMLRRDRGTIFHCMLWCMLSDLFDDEGCRDMILPTSPSLFGESRDWQLL